MPVYIASWCEKPASLLSDCIVRRSNWRVTEFDTESMHTGQEAEYARRHQPIWPLLQNTLLVMLLSFLKTILRRNSSSSFRKLFVSASYLITMAQFDFWETLLMYARLRIFLKLLSLMHTLEVILNIRNALLSFLIFSTCTYYLRGASL